MEVLCAALAGMTARLVTHPMDTIKTITFTGFAGEPAAAAVSSSSPLRLLRASGLRSAVCAVWQREGVRGFYRGIGISVLGAAPGVALYLGSYYYITSACTQLIDSHTHSLDKRHGSGAADCVTMWPTTLREVAAQTLAQTPRAVLYLLSGFAAEGISCMFWVPIDVIKERLQSQPPALRHRYRNSAHALRTVARYEGVRGLYRGYWTTLGSYGPYSAIYFVCYEAISQRLQLLSSSSSSFLIAFCAGACANVVAAVCTNPLEFVKTRLQVQSTVLERSSCAASTASRLYPYAYSGLLHGLRTTAQREGVTALWRGVGTRILYAAPNAALTMAFFELLRARVVAR